MAGKLFLDVSDRQNIGRVDYQLVLLTISHRPSSPFHPPALLVRPVFVEILQDYFAENMKIGIRESFIIVLLFVLQICLHSSTVLLFFFPVVLVASL